MTDYLIPSVTIEYPEHGKAAIKNIKLNCGETSDLEDMVITRPLEASYMASELYQLFVRHTPLDRVQNVMKETGIRPGELIPVVHNDQLITADDFITRFLNNFQVPEREPIPGWIQALLVTNSIADTEHWCPSMKWAQEYGMHNARN